MTISHHGPGLMLCLSRQELSGSGEDPLPLIRRILANARLPLPPAVEIRCFPGREELIFFLLPQPLTPYGPTETAGFPC